MMIQRLDHSSVRALIADLLHKYRDRWFCFSQGCLASDSPWQIVRAESDEDSRKLNLTVRHGDGSVVDHRFTTADPYGHKSIAVGLYKCDDHPWLWAGFVAVMDENHVPPEHGGQEILAGAHEDAAGMPEWKQTHWLVSK